MLKKILPVIILAIGIGGFMLLNATRPEPEPASATERRWLVDVMSVEPAIHAPALPLYGQLYAPDQTTVTSALAGRIASRPVREGQGVKQGELLVALDDADIRPVLAQAKAEVDDLEAQLVSERVRHDNDRKALEAERELLETASRQLERTRSLVNRDLASQEELDGASDALARARLSLNSRELAVAEHPSRVQSLEARLSRAESALESAQRDAQRATVKAPFDGVVTDLQVAEGDRVSQNAPLLSVYPQQGLELRARVPDRFRQELLDALASLEPLEAISQDGKHRFHLARFAGSSDPSGTEAIFTLQGAPGGLRPGDLVPVTLMRPPTEGAIAIPYSALYGSDRVYRMTDEGRMQSVRVQRLGEARDEHDERRVLVRADELESGDVLITTHLPNAMTGLKVEQADEAP